MPKQKKALVTGAGGFIGHHLVKYLQNKGYWVRGVDIKYPEFSTKKQADQFMKADLREKRNCIKAAEEMDEVYNLAANMGGIGFITFHTSDVLYDNVLINANMAEACKQAKVERIFYSSSACVYPIAKQKNPNVTALKESDAYPGDPDNEYGWEKLFSERLYTAYKNYYKVRIARFHNIFGEEGTYEGGREKAPAAMCRKVAKTKDGSTIEIWGDGKQTRSFCHVDDCIDAVYGLMQSDHDEPINIGSDRLVTINQLADIVSKIANKKLTKKHLLDKPQGVRGRNSDNKLFKKKFGWAPPRITLEEGLERNYKWIEDHIKKGG